MESRFVSQLQLGGVTRAGQLPRQEGRFLWEDPFFGRGWQGRCGAVEHRLLSEAGWFVWK